MAEEQPQTQIRTNGEQMQLTIGGKSLGIRADSLIPILLLIGVIVGGVLIWMTTQHRLDLIQGVLVRILEHQAQEKQHADEHLDAFRRMLEIHERNRDRPPEDRLPLDIDFSQVPTKKPEK